jgi:magnesium transporter
LGADAPVDDGGTVTESAGVGVTASGTRERGCPYSVYLSSSGHVETTLRPPRLVDAVKEEGGQLWVDVDANDRAQHALLEKVFGFHHLAVEDTLSPKTRVKLEEYPGYLFLVVRVVRLDQKTDDPYDLETFNLYCFLGQNYLVTVHSALPHAVEVVRDRLARSPDLLKRGVEMIAHGMLDVTVDDFLPIVDHVDERVDVLEEQMFERYQEKAIREIFAVRRLVVQLRRHLGPLREVLNVLTNRPHACIAVQSQLYYRDVYDHTIRIVESIESMRDLLGSVLETFLTQQSNRMNRQMKSLSVVATLSLPLVVIGGVFGMNFSQMPLTHDPWGFFWALGIMTAFAAVIWWFLKRQGWL